MKTTILIVLTIATVTVPCLAQEIEPDGFFPLDVTERSTFSIFPFISPYDKVYFTSLWEYSCFPPTEDFNPIFEDILNGGIGFNLKGVFEAFWDNGECHFVLNSQSDFVIRWYVNDFETVNFMPIIFFEFEERYGEEIANATWSYNYKGVVFPLLNVGLLYIWMDASNALQFDEILNCSMKRQSAPKKFGFCTSYVHY